MDKLLFWEPDTPYTLSEDQLSEEWIMDSKETVPFKKMVVSWNSKTHENTTVEVWIRIRTNHNWSKWFSYGKWTTDGNNTGSFSGQVDAFAKLDIDELSVIDGTGDAIQLKLELTRRNKETQSPTVRKIYVSLKTEHDLEQTEVEVLDAVRLDVPSKPQLVVEEIGNIICSPASLAMVMAFHGEDLPTETVAKGTIDNGTSIYGNWSYNVAYAGERGFDAHVKYCDGFKEVYDLLKAGYPTVASIQVKDQNTLEGAPQAYPSGHLIVIKGFEMVDGVPWVLVNDPAVRHEADVLRKYRYDQLMNAWKNVIYVLKR